MASFWGQSRKKSLELGMLDVQLRRNTHGFRPELKLANSTQLERRVEGTQRRDDNLDKPPGIDGAKKQIGTNGILDPRPQMKNNAERQKRKLIEPDWRLMWTLSVATIPKCANNCNRSSQ